MASNPTPAAKAPHRWAGTKHGLPRGARPSPRHELAAATPFRALTAPPPQVIVIPSKLEYWLNNQEGDCVTAESAAAKAFYSVMSGIPEVLITDAAVQAFCSKYGFCDGADLSEVLDAMASDGFHEDGQTYKEGPKLAVDYTSDATLRAAVAVGPVKIAIDADALPSGAGQSSGWSAFGGRPGQWPNTDHCVSVVGYGPAGVAAAALGVPLPSGVTQATPVYLLYTWATIGMVDWQWLQSTCVEAWVRNPTTPGQGPTPGPTPGPGPTPTGNLLTLAGDLPAGTYTIGGGGLPPGAVALSAELAGQLRTALGMTAAPAAPGWLVSLCRLYRSGALALLPAPLLAIMGLLCGLAPAGTRPCGCK